MMAKLRVGWTVGDCAPGVRTMRSSAAFHCTTGSTDGAVAAVARGGSARVADASVGGVPLQAAASRPTLIGRRTVRIMGPLDHGRRAARPAAAVRRGGAGAGDTGTAHRIFPTARSAD